MEILKVTQTVRAMNVKITNRNVLEALVAD